MRLHPMALAAAAALVLAAFVGCGSSGPTMVPIKGTLTIGGKPAENVTISFVSSDPKLPSASGKVSGGSFQMFSGAQGIPGVVPGKYKVVLAEQASAEQDAAAYKAGGRRKPKMSFPAKYASAGTSDYEIEVKPGQAEVKIELPGP